MATLMMSPRSPRMDGRRATLSNFGSMLPRPQQQQHQQCAPARGQPINAPSWLQVSAGAMFSPRASHTAATAGDIRPSTFAQKPPGPVVGPAVESAVPRLALGQRLDEGTPQPQSSPRLSPRQSPRMPNTARGDNRPLTLGTFGAMLQRPGQGQQANKPSSGFSQMLSPRLETRVVPDPDMRSGVVYERDGFECFYGVGGGDDMSLTTPVAEKQTEQRHKRDGFDKFYGIRSSDRRPEKRQHGSEVNLASAAAATGSTSAASDTQAAVEGEQASGGGAVRSRRLSAASQCASSVPSLAGVPKFGDHGGAKTRSSASLFKVYAPPPRANGESGLGGTASPAEAQTFSMSTPAAPGPSFTPAPVPGGVEVFRMSTPGPGSPS